MKHRYATIFLTASLLLLAPRVFADTGFVDSPLLLSPESPKDGDTVTLSVLFHNAETSTITGTVLFYDNQTLLARDNLNIAPGDVGIADTSFVITPGIHKFSATMSDVDGGGSEPIVISAATVTLPPAIVAKKLSLGAQASGDGADAQGSVILQKVDSAEQAVLGAIPDGAKEAVSNTAESVDDFRASTGEKFIEKRDELKAGIEAGKKIDAENAALKPGKKPVAKPVTADNSSAAEVKYYFFAMLGFFFSKPFAFYLGSVFIFYFILRFIIRRIRAMRER